MTPTRLTLQAVKEFISNALPSKLRRDLANHLLVKEADVECACYLHIRTFLGDNSRWKVLARRYVPLTKKYIDLVIFEEHIPRIAIEIEWGTKGILQKDRKSLNDALTILGVNKAYWISASGLGATPRPTEKKFTEKYSLKHIFVRSNFTPEEESEWRNSIPKYRGKMATGRGRKLHPVSSLE